MKYTKRISTSAKEAGDLEERMKAAEEKLNILNDRINDLVEKQRVASERPKDSSDTAPIEYDDEWYTNHGHGD